MIPQFPYLDSRHDYRPFVNYCLSEKQSDDIACFRISFAEPVEILGTGSSRYGPDIVVKGASQFPKEIIFPGRVGWSVFSADKGGHDLVNVCLIRGNGPEPEDPRAGLAGNIAEDEDRFPAN